MHKNTGFTLVEVLVAVALTGLILMMGYSSFQNIMLAQSKLSATIDIQKNLFYANEKLATLIRSGGTIDYEEYFNRRMLGYSQDWVDFDSNGTKENLFTFTTASHFGNGNDTIRPPIYYCGVGGWTLGEGCMGANSVYIPPVPPIPLVQLPALHQPYGQYVALALNYLDTIGYPVPIKLPPIFESSAQVSIFKGLSGFIVAQNATDVWLPELYLIKQNLDGTYERTYFRHVYIQDPDSARVCTPATLIDGCLGKIQMTKLMDCDNYDASWALTPDGIIEAWIPAPDFRVGTVVCPDAAAKIYTSAHEDTLWANAANLAWVDVTSPDMNVIRAAFLPSPLKIPSLMSGSGEDTVLAPRVSVSLEVTLSTRLLNKSFIPTANNSPRTLITTYDLSE